MKPPCKDCPERKGGCAVTCPKWREYIAERDKQYEKRVWYSEYAGYRHDKCSAVKHRLYHNKKGKRK
jgi:hypothetical protein